MTPKIADFIKLLWFVNISYDIIEMGGLVLLFSLIKWLSKAQSTKQMPINHMI